MNGDIKYPYVTSNRIWLHFTEQGKKLIPFVEVAMEVLFDSEIRVIDYVTFDVEDMTNSAPDCFGYTCKEDKPEDLTDDIFFLERGLYRVVINEKLLLDKDRCINTIIHQFLHVQSKLEGKNGGHGKEWVRLANQVNHNSSYIISRFREIPPMSNVFGGGFYGLTQEEQEEKLFFFMHHDPQELISDYISIYFELEDQNLKDEFAVFYLEYMMLATENIEKAPIEVLLPAFMVNDHVGAILAFNHIRGRYKDILDTEQKEEKFKEILDVPANDDYKYLDEERFDDSDYEEIYHDRVE